VAAAFQDQIYTRKAYENGFLKSWPNWVSSLLYPLLVINAALWLLGLGILISQVEPLAHEIMQVLKLGAANLKH
jgi:hypothetical protein